jgi:dTDP-4-amino-4,6-dideoxygalactose transaminase
MFEITQEEIDAAVRTLKSGQYILGEEVENLEKEVAEYYGKKYAIGVGNGTDALFLSLRALGIGTGDEVITTPFTFVASSEVIANVGAKPVFVDINYNDFLINPDLIEKAITKRTKAILPVHLFGQACSQKIIAIAKKHKLKVIEDAAQAFGNKYIGLGDLLCFSFHPAKCLGCCGDGGMILTNDEELAKKIRLLHYHGAQPHDKYNNLIIGHNSRLDAVQAAILRIRLKNFDKNPIKTLLTFRIKNRDFVFEQMKKAGCDVKIFYKTPMYLQPAFKYLGLKEGLCPVCEEACKSVISMNTWKRNEV